MAGPTGSNLACGKAPIFRPNSYEFRRSILSCFLAISFNALVAIIVLALGRMGDTVAVALCSERLIGLTLSQNTEDK